MAVNVNPRSSVSPAINMTPLIDVLLVLMIVFMIIAPAAPVGIPVLAPRPDDGQAPAGPSNIIVIQLNQEGAIFINQEEVPAAGLGARLKEIFKARADKVAFVTAEGSLEFQRVVRVIDVARASGVENIGLLNGKWQR